VKNPDEDVQVLRSMLPVPAERDFPPGRGRQHEEHLMTSWLHLSARSGRRRRLAVRATAPVVLAAAAVGAFVALQPSTEATVGHAPSATASRGAGPVPADSPLARISTAAYTLDQPTGDTVEITVRAGAASTANAAQLQKDLAAMGIRARVAKGLPHTSPAIYVLARRDKDGDFVAALPRKLASKYPETIVFAPTPNGPNALTVTLDNI
jgi:hypothetical protein